MLLICRMLGATALCVASLLATARAAMEVGSAGDVELNDTSRHKTLQVRVTYPEADGTFPLIVFSHGAWSTKDEYQPLVRHWASQGYVVLQANHADSAALGGRQSADSFEGWADRARDVSALIDQLDQIEEDVPDMHGKIDRRHIGVAGHSFGGQTTQLVAGYRTGGSQSYRDDRVSAVVLLSPPGGVPNDSPQSWADIRIPMLSIVGSADTSMRTGGDYEWRLDAYRNSGSSDTYAIVVDGAEHLLGGISETRQGGKPVPRVPEQLTLVLDATTDFWNGYLKNDGAARNALASGEVVSASAAAASFESKSGAERKSEGAPASVSKSTGTAPAAPAASTAKQVDLGPTLPYDVEKLEWRDEKRDRPIPVKVFAPTVSASPGKLPTIVFSHGYGESRDSFEYLGQYWARHGYIGVFITHPGSDREHLNTKGLPRGDIENTFDPRPLDIRYVADRLAQSDPGSKLLRGRVDLDRLAMAGQCMGSTTALFMVGLQIQNEDGSHYSDPDPRFKVAVALSPQMPRSLMLQGTRAGGGAGGTFGQGSQRELYSGSWENIDVPTLIVTGTLDYTLFPSVRKDPDLRRMAYDGLAPGDKYLVDIVGAEHDAFTDSEPWYPSGPRDPRHHDWIGEATTAFLDAYLKDDEELLAWLQDNGMNKETNGGVQQENKTGAAQVANLPPPADAKTSGPTLGGGGAGGGGGQRAGGGGVSPSTFMQRFDTDGDGELSREEAPQRLASRGFDNLDRDGDGRLSESELEPLMSRIAGGQGGGRGAGGEQDGGRASGTARSVPSAPAGAASGSVPTQTVDVPAGSYSTASQTLALQDASRRATVNISVTYPQNGEGSWPVIVFSPSQTGNKENYSDVLATWASHGYVCIGSDHADTPNSGRSSEPGYVDRPADVSFILDQLEEIEREVPALAGKIDKKHIGVGGHYLGAYTAYLVAGAVRHPSGRDAEQFEDPRVSAVFLISPEGTGQGMTEDSWEGIDIPMMTITGSRDYSPRTGKPPEWRTEPYNYSSPGDKYLLFIDGYQASRRTAGKEGASTYGEVVGDAIASYVYSASIDFWDAYLKGDAEARERLESAELQTQTNGTVAMSHK